MAHSRGLPVCDGPALIAQKPWGDRAALKTEKIESAAQRNRGELFRFGTTKKDRMRHQEQGPGSTNGIARRFQPVGMSTSAENLAQIGETFG